MGQRYACSSGWSKPGSCPLVLLAMGNNGLDGIGRAATDEHTPGQAKVKRSVHVGRAAVVARWASKGGKHRAIPHRVALLVWVAIWFGDRNGCRKH